MVSSEAALLGLQTAVFSLCPCMVFILCVSSFYKNAVILDSGPSIRLLFNVVSSLKMLSPSSHVLSYWGLGLQHQNIGEAQFSHHKGKGREHLDGDECGILVMIWLRTG